jgi:Dyp-type peroxidase family
VTAAATGTAMSRKPAEVRPDATTWADVQGLVMSGYSTMHQARYLLLRVDEPSAARAWIGELAGRVTSGAAPETERCINVAFTAPGLRALGLETSELQTFPAPFTEGMTATHRRRSLGDLGPSDPTEWYWGGTAHDAEAGAHAVHVLLLLFAPDATAIAALEAAETALLTAGGLSVVREIVPEPLPGQQTPDGKFGVEHFGFADGMSQPVIRDSGQDEGLGWDEARRSVIAAGEFVLGYDNGYAKLTPWPQLAGADRFGVNGTFLVVRQLAQDVAGFRTHVESEAARLSEDPERLAAKLVGRWRSGAPLVLTDDRDDPDLDVSNDFSYAELDPDGRRCPFGSHIRRANPRDSLLDDPVEALKLANLHRIIRRGRVFGPGLPDDARTDDGHERGLVFVAVNANIERQFEFVQHSWIANPTFAGLAEEQDPMVGNPTGGGTFTVQARPLRKKVTDLPSFVTVRGGAYFFLPGITALRTLGARPA